MSLRQGIKVGQVASHSRVLHELAYQFLCLASLADAVTEGGIASGMQKFEM